MACNGNQCCLCNQLLTSNEHALDGYTSLVLNQQPSGPKSLNLGLSLSIFSRSKGRLRYRGFLLLSKLKTEVKEAVINIIDILTTCCHVCSYQKQLYGCVSFFANQNLPIYTVNLFTLACSISICTYVLYTSEKIKQICK